MKEIIIACFCLWIFVVMIVIKPYMSLHRYSKNKKGEQTALYIKDKIVQRRL
jgi:hypothetical protein